MLPTKKTKTLLTYLALHPGQSYGRETLATLFWGNTPNAQARGSLRQAIAAVRRALLGRGTGVLGTEGDTVALAAEAVHTDVAEFKRLLDDGGLENLERGLALYRGELLQGFSFREEGLEEWLWVEREQLREMALTGLDKLLWHHVEVGAVELGIAVGSRLLALDPLREEVHRAMMGLYLEQGRRPSALRQYQICRELLERELGVEPEAETERIYEQARRSISKPRFSGSSATGRNAARGAEEDARDEVGIPPNGELRQVTVLFAELAEFARLSGKLGVEQIHMLLGRYLDVVDDVVHRYGGVVSAHIGDTVMAMFGYPRAHEDDAQRAVQAGLELVEAISESESKGWSDEFALAVQVAISTGLVVAERSVSGDEGVVGAPVTVATRLLSVAEPGSVVIGQATRRLVDGLFICEGLGHQDLRGLSEPVAAYRVRGQSGAPSRFEATADRGLTPLVGRKAEIALLWDRWRQVENGEGQVVLLSGEAGIGKSRIVREFRDRLASFQVLYYCSPYHTNTMLYPAIKQLERALGFERGDSGQQKLDKLEAMVQSHGLAVQETVPLLAPLLSLPLSDRYSVPVLSRPVQKQRTLETLVALVGAMAEREPVLMVVEDVHWIDPTTLELLGQFTERAHTARILLVITFRPEFEPPWSGYPHLTLHTLRSAVGLPRLPATGQRPAQRHADTISVVRRVA